MCFKPLVPRFMRYKMLKDCKLLAGLLVIVVLVVLVLYCKRPLSFSEFLSPEFDETSEIKTVHGLRLGFGSQKTFVTDQPLLIGRTLEYLCDIKMRRVYLPPETYPVGPDDCMITLVNHTDETFSFFLYSKFLVLQPSGKNYIIYEPKNMQELKETIDQFEEEQK